MTPDNEQASPAPPPPTEEAPAKFEIPDIPPYVPQGACIYVAGPLNATTAPQYLRNLSRMCYASLGVAAMGHHPLNPGLDYVYGIMHGHMEYKHYADMNLAWVTKADALLALAPSPGTNREIAVAMQRGIPVLTCWADIKALVQSPDGRWTVDEALRDEILANGGTGVDTPAESAPPPPEEPAGVKE